MIDAIDVRPQPLIDQAFREKLLNLGRAAADNFADTLISVVVAAPDINPVAIFRAAGSLGRVRAFWEAPEQSLALVGVDSARIFPVGSPDDMTRTGDGWQRLGAHATIEAPSHIPHVGPLLLGGAAFDSSRARDAVWGAFGNGFLLLPRLMMTYCQNQAWLTCNLIVNRATDIEREVETLVTLYAALLESGTPMTAGDARSPVLTQHETMPAAVWQDLVARTSALIRQGDVQKVVLARSSVIELHNAPDQSFSASRILGNLRHSHRRGYIFAVGVGDQTFLGATPERLVRLRDGQVEVAALAGSIERGATAAEDERGAVALLADHKNLREHELVVETIEQALAPLCRQIDVPAQPQVLRTPTVQHLYTPISGTLSDYSSALDLVQALHPTPAVCGLPRQDALDIIGAGEGFDRGWYAGPVGWIDLRGDGEFAVALRSGVVRPDRVVLYAGCGIVGESQPDSEYQESVLKMRPMLQAIEESI